MLRLGILGCGRIGQVHASAAAWLDGVTVTAVADAFPEAAEKLATQYGAQARDLDAVIESDDVDAVLICTPTTTHYDIIHRAAAAGKAIFCEKPVDLSSERILDCARAVTDAGVPFFTAFNRRFDPQFAALERRVRAGEIGTVEMVVITSRDPSPPPLSYIETSGGLFRDMMIHDLDMARFLLGEEPVTIHAVGSALVDPAIGKAGDVDTAAVTLTTASGKICQINNSRRATYGYDQRAEVHGSNGMLRIGNILKDTVEVADSNGFSSAVTEPFFLERYQDAYRNELRHFRDALASGAALSPGMVDGYRAQLLADLAAKSQASGLPQSVNPVL